MTTPSQEPAFQFQVAYGPAVGNKMVKINLPNLPESAIRSITMVVCLTETQFRASFPELNPRRHICAAATDSDGFEVTLTAEDAIEGAGLNAQSHIVEQLDPDFDSDPTRRLRSEAELSLQTIDRLLDLKAQYGPDDDLLQAAVGAELTSIIGDMTIDDLVITE